ncbi:MAG TPA: hypothetical protein VMQ76_02960, partial [Terracidiphilus sp.]|nr:hypothetical protein [Terracidiphilus sp.]
ERGHFGKEIFGNSYLVKGAAVPFEPLPGNHGVIALESPKDDELIAALNKASDDQVGGIYRLTEESYNSKKNAAALTPLSPPKREMLRAMPKGPFERKLETAQPADGALPLTDAALRKANLVEAARLAGAPAPAAPLTEAPAEPTVDAIAAAAAAPPPVADEGFRPATRRISRKPAPALVPAHPA